jgi:hypothetical protein
MRAHRPKVILAITYTDIFGGDSPTRSDLAEVVSRMNWRDAATASSGLSAITWQHGIEDPEHQAMIESFVKDLPYGPALVVRLRSDQSRVLFTRESLLAVLRAAVVGRSNATNSLLEHMDFFTKANLIASELIHTEIDPPNRTNTSADLLGIELRSNIQKLENPHDLLARTSALFHWSRTPVAQASHNALALETDLAAFTGLTPIEFAAGAYSVLARAAAMRTPNDVSQSKVFFTLGEWQRGLKQTHVLTQWAETNSVSISAGRDAWAAEQSLSFAAAGPLWRRPLVQDEGGRYFAPCFQFIANSMGDGTYFALLDGYNGETKDKFTRLYGEFFEQYVVELLRTGYAGRTDCELHREFEYERDGQVVKSSDLIIAEGNHIMFVEVVAKRLNLVTSVLRLDDESIQRDITKGVLEKAWQLNRNLADYRDGVLLPDLPRHTGQRLYPLLVAPRDWPRVWVIDNVLPEEQREKGLLTEAEPLEMLDVAEVEFLEPALSAGRRLAELLDRKNRSPVDAIPYRMLSLHDYLIRVEPSFLPEVTTPTRRRGDELAAELIHLMESWA